MLKEIMDSSMRGGGKACCEEIMLSSLRGVEKHAVRKSQKIMYFSKKFASIATAFSQYLHPLSFPQPGRWT